MTGDNPHVGKVADLLDPYLTHQAKHTGGNRHEGGSYQAWWLRQHPGRWALVGLGGTGLSRDWCVRNGFTHSSRDSYTPGQRIYAQSPHPLGESLTAALKRGNRTEPPALYLPELTKSDFGWTPEELADAARHARTKLFPERTRARS